MKRLFTCILCALMAMMAMVWIVPNTWAISAAQVATANHPLVLPFPGARLVPAQSRLANFDAYSFMVKKGQGTNFEKVEKRGRYWGLRYLIKDSQGKINRRVSKIEIVENYKNAALQHGGTILYDYYGRLTFTIPMANGGTLWAQVNANNGAYNLYIVEEQPMQQQLSFGAQTMATSLDTYGSVSVYGINFDVDQSTLQLGSEKVLTEIVKLMKARPDLKVEIQGHTDNTGSPDYNLTLSNRRAETVKRFLSDFGVPANRLTSKGYGMTKPLAPNTTDAGRAKNRRVELVKIN